MALIGEVRSLVDRGLRLAVAEPQVYASLERVLASLDGPLKIAVAGRVKAGKSTLVNALIGDQIAPTDAGECTQIVTWFRGGLTYRVDAIVGDIRHPVPFRRDGSALEMELGGLEAGDVTRIEVEWPTPALRSHTIIDTPGLGSLNAATSERARSFLTPEDERVTEADAVLYLMRHVHQSDADFLEAFHDEQVAQAAPLNAIAVLSRADEIGVGRLDAMDSARAIAAGYRADRKIRRVCATVVPVAGLLAQAGAALRESEFAAFRSLASLPADMLERLLWSVDRFRAPDGTDALTGEERRFLIDQFGLFGVRLATEAVRSGAATTAGELSALLIAQSGIADLREVLDRSFTARRDLLIARSALLGLRAMVESHHVLMPLGIELERVISGAHELAEARCLNVLRGGTVSIGEHRQDALERLLGADGVDPRSRLGLAADSSEDDLRAAAGAALERYQTYAESSLGGQELRDFARVAVRTCEGLLVEFHRNR